MASVRRKPFTRFWVCCYTDRFGVQRQRSSKSTDRRFALGMAERLEEAYQRNQTEAQMRRVLSAVHEELHGKPLADVTLGKYIDGWLPRVKAEVSPGTFDRYSDSYRVVKELSAGLLATKIDQVVPTQLIDCRDAMLEKRSASTVNTNMKLLRSAFRAAWMDGLISENIAAKVPKARETKAAAGEGRRPFTTEELRLLLKKADAEWSAMILTGLYTAGQRLGDVARLRRSQIDFELGTISLRPGKTGKWVPLPLHPVLERVLKKMAAGKKPTDPMFPRAFAKLRDGGGDVSRISAQFGRLLYRAGLAENPSTAKAKTDGRRTSKALSFHSLRHSATSMLKNAGVSNSVAMDIVGHDSEAVSREYTHIDDATKRAAMSKLPDITK